MVFVLLAILLITAGCANTETNAPLNDLAVPTTDATAKSATPLTGSLTRRASPSSKSAVGIVTPAAAPETIYRDIWPIDANTIWLAAQTCQPVVRPTPDPAQPPSASAASVCRGLLFVSHDAGQSWLDQPLPDPSLIPQTLQFTDASHGVLILNTSAFCNQGPCSSVIDVTNDGGNHWEAIYHTDPNTPDLMIHGKPVIAQSVDLTTLAFPDANNGWAFGQGCSGNLETTCQPILMGTNDGGGGWSQIGLPEATCPCLSMSHPTVADGWIVTGSPGASPEILATHNGGQTWSEIPDPVAPEVNNQIEIYFSSATNGWLLAGGPPGVGQEAKALYRTTDGGQTWTEIADAPFGDQSHGLQSSGYVGPIIFSTDLTGWIVTAREGLLRSTDGGHHWAPDPNIGYRDDLLAIRFPDQQDGWLLASDRLWRTTDGGSHWSTLVMVDTDT